MSIIDDAGTQITDKGLMELVRRLEPFFLGRTQRGGGGTDDAVRFNNANTSIASRWLAWVTNLRNPDTGLGLDVSDTSGDVPSGGGMRFQSSGGFNVETTGTIDNTGDDSIRFTGTENKDISAIVSGSGTLHLETAGVAITMTSGSVTVGAAGGSVRVDANGVEVNLAANKTFEVHDHFTAALLVTDEATGVTSGVFDGGGP